MVTLRINGMHQSFEQSLHIDQLLQRLSLAGKKIAVEHNGELVRRSDYSSCLLVEGDQLEIVLAVGGG